ncbi:hypothetical protein [Fodinicola acaciae]|uniref:WXG100-like domain-containing protein n=1 Tax=Fodinicola acaciae TaxID=2681555 RepID=UPI0013D68C28|nr:hypothetical protein [Fodinicola acaciae]
MGLQLPAPLVEALGWVGYDWPHADEEKLAEVGASWIEFGSQLLSRLGEANQSASTITTQHSGDDITAFGTQWSGADGPSQHLADGATAAFLIGAAMIVAAVIVLILKLLIIIQLIILLIEVIQAIASAAPSFGATLAEIPGFIAAARVAIRTAIKKAVTWVEEQSIKTLFKKAWLLLKAFAKQLRKEPKIFLNRFRHGAGSKLSKAERDTLFSRARQAREDGINGLTSRTAKSKTTVGGVNIRTGETAFGKSGPRGCAEDDVVHQLGGNRGDVLFSTAERPRGNLEMPVCRRNCQTKFTRDQFEPGTKFDGFWTAVGRNYRFEKRAAGIS